MCCRVLQYVARGVLLQCVAARRFHVARKNGQQPHVGCVAVCCSALQCPAVRCSCAAARKSHAAHMNGRQPHAWMRCSVLQRVAACCSVLHCATIVLQRGGLMSYL